MARDYRAYNSKNIEDDFFPLPETNTLDAETEQRMIELSMDRTSRHYTGYLSLNRGVIWKQSQNPKHPEGTGYWVIRLENPESGWCRDITWMSREEWDIIVDVPELNAIFG